MIVYQAPLNQDSSTILLGLTVYKVGRIKVKYQVNAWNMMIVTLAQSSTPCKKGLEINQILEDWLA